MFKGHRTFNEFLHSGEGMASNVLTDRLAKLEAARIVEKRENAGDARRYDYRLTARGIDLAPVMVEIVLWSARHEETDAPPQILRAMRLQRANFLAETRRKLAAGPGR